MKCAGAAALALAFLMPTAASAQSGAQVYSSFLLTARAPDLAASLASSSIAFGLPAGVTVPVAIVCNLGPSSVYVQPGPETVSADPGLSELIFAGTCARVNVTGFTNLAAIAANDDGGGTAIVQTMLGSGNP